MTRRLSSFILEASGILYFEVSSSSMLTAREDHLQREGVKDQLKEEELSVRLELSAYAPTLTH